MLNNGELHNLHGNGRGNYAAIATSSILNKGVTSLGHDAVGVFLAVEHAHWLGGILEGAVVLVNNHLSYHCCTRFVDATASELALHCLLQMITNVALGHGTALGERHCGSATAIVGAVLKREVYHTHLWTVAMANYHVISFLNEVNDGRGSAFYQFELLLRSLAQGVTTQSYN